MAITPLSLRNDYWDTYNIQEEDLEFLYNQLLELETPQTTQELVQALVIERVRQEKSRLTSQQETQGTIYRPKDQYQLGQSLSFPSSNWQEGQIIAVRPGNNSEYPPFEVIQVQFSPKETKEFAAGFTHHILNEPVAINMDDPLLNPNNVIQKYGRLMAHNLNEMLEANPDLVRIAGRWFPRALLVDVNIGHLNLTEAVLDMSGGGPLSTHAVLEQIELPTDVNAKLTEFSLNLALQEDGLFDEIGPAGEILWFLRRLEPDAVQNVPPTLRYSPIDYDQNQVLDLIKQLDAIVVDELEPFKSTLSKEDEFNLSLIFPHWRAGTLPLTTRISQFFPTAYESPRVQFTFVDGNSGEKFSGWVVRQFQYVYGLREWYTAQGVFPGSLITVKRGKKPGEVIILANKHRPTREWIRTALIGSDGGIVFAMLKQNISCSYDERMAIAIPDLVALDQLWDSTRSRHNLEQVVLTMMKELSKLNPQGHVHFQELYTTVNLLRRCPPGLILSILTEKPWSHHLGDLYYNLEEINAQGRQND
jgi:hypothetical protein